MSEADAADLLEAAVEDGLAIKRDGRISGYALTAAGRDWHRERLARETGRAEQAAIRVAYVTFMTVNAELLALCTDWQRQAGASVAARLDAVDDRVQPICAALTEVLERFGTYGPRLAAARHRFESGEIDWLTKPLIDSYHTVWFELHEDLLCTLGIERSEEDQS
jgi:hypothetical protein